MSYIFGINLYTVAVSPSLSLMPRAS